MSEIVKLGSKKNLMVKFTKCELFVTLNVGGDEGSFDQKRDHPEIYGRKCEKPVLL